MTHNRPALFRFAPSPNGALHLGHAYCALLNQRMAQAHKGTLLLRIEDIDTIRCTPHLQHNMINDLQWLGIEWAEKPRQQSQHFAHYQTALEQLQQKGLVYPAFMSRSAIKKEVAAQKAQGHKWPHDPDGAPHYPGDERDWPQYHHQAMIEEGKPFAWRLNMQKALSRICTPLFWTEFSENGTEKIIKANPALWGDVILARSDIPTSYHLSVVVDDALQNITHVVRGKDLFHATSVHRLLQVLLGLPCPHYHHHELILDENGQKLSKSTKATSLRALRDAGWKACDVITHLNAKASTKKAV